MDCSLAPAAFISENMNRELSIPKPEPGTSFYCFTQDFHWLQLGVILPVYFGIVYLGYTILISFFPPQNLDVQHLATPSSADRARSASPPRHRPAVALARSDAAHRWVKGTSCDPSLMQQDSNLRDPKISHVLIIFWY